MAAKVAAIFAHPDDEVLSCGGSLALHASRGERVSVLILGTGLSSRSNAGASDIQLLRDQARQAADILGTEHISFADFPDNAMDSIPLLEIIQRVEAFLEKHPAEVVYTHHGGDLNIDHRLTHKAVLTALRPTPQRGAMTILGCEINSSTEWAVPPLDPFLPTEFQDIGETLKKKLDALGCYAGELREWPHPRSIEGVRIQARWRGYQSGVDAAEAFVTLRRIRTFPDTDVPA